tara:strand:- start:598 stop:867 length:270 start_codon:yes stop_codon:yes gene_type:complete
MSGIKEREYLKICAELASCLSISISAATKKIDIAAAKKEYRDLSSRKKLAEALLKEAKSRSQDDKNSITGQLDTLLEALASEENFLVED